MKTEAVYVLFMISRGGREVLTAVVYTPEYVISRPLRERSMANETQQYHNGHLQDPRRQVLRVPISQYHERLELEAPGHEARNKETSDITGTVSFEFTVHVGLHILSLYNRIISKWNGL